MKRFIPICIALGLLLFLFVLRPMLSGRGALPGVGGGNIAPVPVAFVRP